MKTITLGNQTIGIKCTTLTPFYYKQAFGSSLLGDLSSLKDVKDDYTKLDEMLLLQFAWAMAKSCNGPGKGFPDFETWLSQLKQVDFSDKHVWKTVLLEVSDGLFPRRPRPNGRGGHKQKQKR